jgi:long-chain acyl-CoA synthetase
MASSKDKLLEDITIIKPTFICAVPKIAEHIFNTISTNIKQLPPLQRQIVQNIINTKIKFFKKTHCVANNWLSDHIVCDKIRKQFGGRLRFMLVGGATLSTECFSFLKCILKINVINGYGQTENCASAFLSDEKDYRYDHVGGLCNCLEMKLVDVPELGYFTNNVDPKTKVPYPTGELCVRGTTVFKGYYKNSKKTKEVLDDDGWFHTGDICMLLTNHGNAVRIIDRKSNVVKLQNGEFVAIEELETLILSKTKFISQICIIGDSQRPYLVAIVVPKKSQINSDKEALQKSIFEDIVNSYRAIGKYNNIIRAIHIADSPFSLANNMMTPTLKLKRNVIKTVFSKEIEEMYK